jgi:hypothetical protein
MKNLEGTIHMSLCRLLAISTVLALSGTGAYAQGVAPGNYAFAFGSAAPCPVTLAADGSATVDASCKSSFSQWRKTPTGIELRNQAGEIYAALVEKDGAYKGTTFSSTRSIVLAPASQTAGLAH